MTQSNPHTESRKAVEAKIERLQALLPELRLLEAEWAEDAGSRVTWTETDLNGGSATAAKPRKRGGRRAAMNPDGPTWTEAIREVLRDGQARTVAEIVAELETRGRVFGPNTRADALIRGTLNRTKDREGWTGRGTPKWRLPRG